MKPSTLIPFALLTAASSVLLTPAARASEIAATHLVFEKAVKMKKANAFLFLPLLDQSRRSDVPDGSRLVDCRVFAEGKTGPLAVKGAFRLQLTGELSGTAEPWASDRITRPVDADGRGTFQPVDLLSLVDDALTDGIDARLLRIEFDGGKGKKVTRLTVDCENREAES